MSLTWSKIKQNSTTQITTLILPRAGPIIDRRRKTIALLWRTFRQTRRQEITNVLTITALLSLFYTRPLQWDGWTYGRFKNINSAKRFYYWPGMFHWRCALTAGCLTCRNKKPKPKHGNEVPMEEWQNETVPFPTIHIDHKGPVRLSSNRNLPFLLVIDAFSCLLMIYLAPNTGAQATITYVEEWIHSFGIPQSIVLHRGTAFITIDFINWTKELGITLRHRTSHSLWTNGKTETQNQHIAR